MKKLTNKAAVYDLLAASTVSAALGTAFETGLLWQLAETPLDAAGVAQAFAIPLKRCAYWLQCLHALGILKMTPGGYAPSAMAHKVILNTYSQESWAHLAADARERSAGVHNLAQYIREPDSVWKAQGLAQPRDYVDKMRASPERAREFTRMLYEIHQNLGNELAELLDMAGVQRLMDLGGGSGVVSMALLRKYPGLTATVVDIENVCAAGREIAEENSLADRITYQPLDFSREELPGGFDMILFCDVLPGDETLYRKIWRALQPGGRVVVVFHLSPAENLAPTQRLEWTFLDSLEDPAFSIPTSAQLRAQLAQASFHVLPGEPLTSTSRSVIQAWK